MILWTAFMWGELWSNLLAIKFIGYIILCKDSTAFEEKSMQLWSNLLKNVRYMLWRLKYLTARINMLIVLYFRKAIYQPQYV